MASSNPSSYGFFGAGAWGRRVFWENVPGQQRHLDTDGYLENLLKTWGDECESFIQQIKNLPLQREPYAVRAEEDEEEWFYFTEAFTYVDDYWGTVVRLVGEKVYANMPETDEDSPPSAVQATLDEWYPWFPYAPISSVARWWWCRWHGVNATTNLQGDDVLYEVVRTRTRNFDQTAIYSAADSLANEVWIKGGDLYIPFTWEGVIIGQGDGTSAPSVVLPFKPVRLDYNDIFSTVPPYLTADAKVTMTMTIAAASVTVYDVPNSPWDGSGEMYPEDGGSPGDIDTGAASYATINYETGEIAIASPSNIDDDTNITCDFAVRGYYLAFRRPRVIDYLARDFGFDNDLNDPEDVQRSTIANLTKYFGLKSSADSYRIRGEVSLFDVTAVPLWKICDADLWGDFDTEHQFAYSGVLYTDLEPRYIRFDDIAADQEFYDPDTSAWQTLIDNSLIYEDSSADGYSIALGYCLDVTQGYYGFIAPAPHPSSAVARDPAGIVDVTLMTDAQALSYGFEAGYIVTVRMLRCQYEAFNFSKGYFGLSEYNKPGTDPPALADTVLWLDDEYVVWTLTSAGATTEEDVGEWQVAIGVGVDSSGNPLPGPSVGHADITAVNVGTRTFTISGDYTSAISAGDTIGVIRSTGNDGTYTVDTVTLVGSDTDVKVTGAVASGVADGELTWIDVAVRYYPEVISGDCCYCRSYRMRMVIAPTAEAYSFYNTTSKLDSAIGRMKNKIQPSITPVHTRVVDWAIQKYWTLENVDSGSTISESITSDFVSDALSDVSAVNQGAQIFTINGDQRSYLTSGDDITIIGSTGNDGTYTMSSVTLNANGTDTDVGVTAAIPSAVADGSLHPFPTKILLKVEYRGDMGAGQTVTMNLYDDAPAVVWTDTSTTNVSDATTWYTVVENEDVTSLIGNNNPVVIEATDNVGTMTYGDVRFTFTVSRYEED